MHRTFVEFTKGELRFLRHLQSITRKTSGRAAPMRKVIQGVVSDYQRVVENRADPDFMRAYRLAAKSLK